MDEIIDAKKTILHLPVQKALLWCFETHLALSSLWMKEMNFRDSASSFTATSLAAIMADGRRTANPHLKRAGELRVECTLTHDLLYFISNVQDMLKKERLSPFEHDMSQDDARSWLASVRKSLKQKIKRERKYRLSVPYVNKNAATEEESKKQEEIVLLLDELLKTFPPKKLPRPRRVSGDL